MDEARGSFSVHSASPTVSMLRVPLGYTNHAGELYDEKGLFIDFPRELGSKKRKNLDTSTISKQFKNLTIACVVHERRNYSYFHWMYETLPKLIYLNEKKKEIKFDRIYYHCGFIGTSYQRQALYRLGFMPWQLLDATRIKSLMAREIVAVKLNEKKLEPSWALCEMIKRTFTRNLSKEPYRKIYLSRTKIKSGRKIINEFELIHFLRSHNFQIVYPEKLSLTKQFKLFSEAKCIISPHGAALSNIVFCSSGTKILELFNHPDILHASQLYSNIARVCNLELLRMPSRPINTGIEQWSHRSNFFVDLDMIEAALQNWLL